MASYDFFEDFSFLCFENGGQNGAFGVETGASSHIFSGQSLFTNFSDKVEHCVKNANDSFAKVEMTGKIRKAIWMLGEKNIL